MNPPLTRYVARQCGNLADARHTDAKTGTLMYSLLEDIS